MIDFKKKMLALADELEKLNGQSRFIQKFILRTKLIGKTGALNLIVTDKSLDQEIREQSECIAGLLAKCYAGELDGVSASYHIRLAVSQNGLLDQGPKISVVNRSRPMTKKYAAKLLGKGGNVNGSVAWLSKCIKDGIITCEKINRQSYYFDIRQFPPESHAKMRVKSN